MISETLRLQVRQRANFACEYCGVTETDSGGELTIDHYQPQSQNGSDELVSYSSKSKDKNNNLKYNDEHCLFQMSWAVHYLEYLGSTIALVLIARGRFS
jgi:hypothetical protein